VEFHFYPRGKFVFMEESFLRGPIKSFEIEIHEGRRITKMSLWDQIQIREILFLYGMFVGTLYGH
jgi:hypothetical protein